MAVKKDSGYAWVVFFSSIAVNFLAMGFCLGVVGVLTPEYEREFRADRTKASSIGSTLFALSLMSGPLAAILISKFGVRLMAVISVTIHFAGFMLSAFATSWWHVIPSFAVFSGLGSCCAYVCTFNILPVYFDRHIQMVYAAMSLGVHCAAMTFPFITAEVVEKLSYRDSILVLSAVLPLAIPCALSFKGAPGPTCCTSSQAEAQPEEETIALNDRPTETLEMKEITDENGSTNGGEINLNKSTSHDNIERVELLQQDAVCSDVAESAEKQCAGAQKEDNSNVEPAVTAGEGHTLRDHLSIFTTPTLLVFTINTLLWNIGCGVIPVLTFSYCLDQGFSTAAASLVTTLYAVGLFTGALIVTIITFLFSKQGKRINGFYLHVVIHFILGVPLILTPFVSFSEIAVTICLFVFGVGDGMIVANVGVLIEHLNGVRNLYLIYSYVMASAGISSLIGPLVAAELDIAFGSGSSLYFSAASIFASLMVFAIYAAINTSILTPFNEHVVEEEVEQSKEEI